MQRAYEQTIEATASPNDWQGTTTAAGAQLYYRRVNSNSNSDTEAAAADETITTTNNNSPGDETSTNSNDNNDNNEAAADATNEPAAFEPLLYVTNLGDSQVMVVRPSTRETVYKSTEQWHWFDCPRQLGTNSPDTPRNCAVVDEVPIREGDIVLAMSDGVIDNLWTHEIAEKVSESLERWRAGEGRTAAAATGLEGEGDESGMGFVAEELMEAAKVIALDPFAESPFMEHAIEEGLASGGGEFALPWVWWGDYGG